MADRQEYFRLYRQRNRQLLRSKANDYYACNKQVVLQKREDYRELVIRCECCKSDYKRADYGQHVKTKKHLKNMGKTKEETQQNEPSL